MKAIRRVWLKSMPLDKWTGNRYIHATGYDVLTEDGRWVTEYEDDEYEDRADCVYEDEADSEGWNEYFRQKDVIFDIVDKDTGEVYKTIEADYRETVNWNDFNGFEIVGLESRNKNEVTVWVRERS